MTIRPIFVFGRHRSGTTWLSNVIASSPEVFAPSHELHRGIHESAFFSHLVRFCNGGRTAADLLAIKELFERSDFFLLTGLAEGPDILRHGFAGYFRLVMEAAARKSGARYWLEKTPAHTLLAKYLSESYPDAILLAMIRDSRAVVASNVHGFGNPRSPWAWFRQAAVTAIYEKIVVRNRVHVIRYEDLRDHHRGTVRSIAEWLGLAIDSLSLDAFDRNSSYPGEAPSFEWWQIAAMACGRGLVRMTPGRLIELAVDRWRRRKAAVLPDWYFLIGSRR